jgi:ATP phosphoribosyltransferase regulatory subunit
MTLDTRIAALLPAGLMDVLPPLAAFEAATVERLVGAFARYGYERVKPPLIEFEETMLAGSGQALTTETFRLMDPVSQKMLALRPDMTMQVARIAASRLGHRPRPLRLSYAGQVMRVRGSQLRPERQFGQVGAEVIGSGEAAADIEVILMATETLMAAGVPCLSVDLGVPSLVAALLADARLDPMTAATLQAALDRKDIPAVRTLAPAIGGRTAQLLTRLIAATGPADWAIAQVAGLDLPAAARAERAALAEVHAGLTAAAPDLTITIDPVEHRGFEYHSGVSFSLFSPAVPGELGRGGRYRSEPGEACTGVTLIMDAVLAALATPSPEPRLFVPVTHGTVAARLRAEGWIVVAGLRPAADAVAEARRLNCTHVWTGNAVARVTPG